MSATRTLSAVADAAPAAAAPSAASAADATRDLYERHQRRILAYCMSQLRNRQEAEDAVQNTFVYAFRLLERGVAPHAELPWLFTIAHNVCRSRRRALWRRGRVEAPADLDALQDVSSTASSSAADDLLGLSGALAAVPDTQRRALVLREWQGLSYAEIATALSLSQSAVETLLFRARRNLAKQLAAAHDRVAVMLNGFVLLRLARRFARTSLGTKATAAAVAAGVVAGAGIPLAHDLHRRPSPPAPSTTAAAATVAETDRATAGDLLRAALQPSYSTGIATHPAAGLESTVPEARVQNAPGTAVPSRRPSQTLAPATQSLSARSSSGEHPQTGRGAGTELPTPPALLQDPLGHTVDQATSVVSQVSKTVSKTVSQASQALSQPVEQTESTASQAIAQTDSTVSDVASSVGASAPTSGTATGPASDAPAPVAAAQQTVSQVETTASSSVSKLLGGP